MKHISLKKNIKVSLYQFLFVISSSYKISYVIINKVLLNLIRKTYLTYCTYNT